LERARATVLVTPGAPTIGARVAQDPIYRSPGRFAPGLAANGRVMARLVLGDAQDVWHFMFAPNPSSSSAARVAVGVRRALGWRGRVVQTIASAPRSFHQVARLMFGDVIVALSEWTRARLIGEGVSADRIRVISPCAVRPAVPPPSAIAQARARYRLGDAPIILYPGDYEVSTGAATFARAIRELKVVAADAHFVFACREKTTHAAAARERLVRELAAAGVEDRVRHVGEIQDLPALMAASRVIAFPVDDLYGKVDVPLVLLEAMALGVPLVLARGGPLEALPHARFVEAEDGAALAAALRDVLAGGPSVEDSVRRGKELYEEQFTPQVVARCYDELYEEMFTERS
jgi:phosphatidylinositol alpha-1,6-mannosyltransferase